MDCNFYTPDSPLSEAQQVRDYCLSLASGLCSSTDQESGVLFTSDVIQCELLMSSLCSDFVLSDIVYNPGISNRVQYKYNNTKLYIWINS